MIFMDKQIITPHSTPAEVDRAFESLSQTFRTMVRKLCKLEGKGIWACVYTACGKENPILFQFLTGKKVVPSGKSFELMMAYFSIQQKFAEKVSVVFSSSVSYAEQVPIPHPNNAVPPEWFDTKASHILGILGWFYTQATARTSEKSA